MSMKRMAALCCYFITTPSAGYYLPSGRLVHGKRKAIFMLPANDYKK